METQRQVLKKDQKVIIYLDPVENSKMDKTEGKAILLKPIIQDEYLEYWEVKFIESVYNDPDYKGLIVPRWVAKQTKKSKLRA